MTVKTALALHEVFTCQQSTDKVFTFTAGILPIPIAKSVESLRKESEREEDVYPARYFLFLFDWVLDSYAHCGDKDTNFSDHVTRLPTFVALSFVAAHQYYKAIQHHIEI
eukprot:scaffold23199_cov79-Skeletonema_marinoi.AAC.1